VEVPANPNKSSKSTGMAHTFPVREQSMNSICLGQPKLEKEVGDEVSPKGPDQGLSQANGQQEFHCVQTQIACASSG
jgi:hypothetical protein